MSIDEGLECTPYRMEGADLVYSDHYMITVKFDWLMIDMYGTCMGHVWDSRCS